LHPTPATQQTYPLSLHDALPISETASGDRPGCRTRTGAQRARLGDHRSPGGTCPTISRFLGLSLEWSRRQRRVDGRYAALSVGRDRKSTRLNSSHEWISYAVFCL